MNGFFALLIGFSLSLALIGLWSAVSWYRALGRSRLLRAPRADHERGVVNPRDWTRIFTPVDVAKLEKMIERQERILRVTAKGRS